MRAWERLKKQLKHAIFHIMEVIMAKRKTGWAEKKIARYYKEGRGQGELASYKPWLTVQDVPSKGRAHRLKGWKTSRIHHLFSDLERNYFYFLEWADDVIDIREQFPTERQRTLDIAEKLNIRHPEDQNTRTPIVFTSDFFITQRIDNKVVYKVRSIKPCEQLNDKRTIEKLMIERSYWQEQNVNWGIVTEKDMPNSIVENINWIHNAYFLPEETDQNYLLDLYEFLKSWEGTVKKALNEFNHLYGLEKGTALHLFKHMLARKFIEFDIKKKFKLTSSIRSLTFKDEVVKERLIV